MKALSGTAYILAPAFMIKNKVKDGSLIPLLPKLKLMERGAMYAVYPHRDLPVRTRLFFDAVREYLGKTTPKWENSISNFDKLYQG